MSLRRLLNVAYAALAQGRDTDGLKELDNALETEPGGRPKRSLIRGDLAAVMAATKLPQGRA
jgi:hypothetical protein